MELGLPEPITSLQLVHWLLMSQRGKNTQDLLVQQQLSKIIIVLSNCAKHLAPK